MKVRSSIQLEQKGRRNTGPFALLTLFLASTFLGGVLPMAQAAEEPVVKNPGVSGTLVPESLRWQQGKNSIFEASNIVITGATLLPFGRIEPLYKNLREEPFKIRDIQGVMRQIARLYRQEGFLGVEIQLDIAQLENGIVAINIIEPEDLKNDIIAQSKGRELKTPKNPPVKVVPQAEQPVEKKQEEPHPREKVIKKAMKELKEPPKTRIEQRLSPENMEAWEAERHIFLLPQEKVKEVKEPEAKPAPQKEVIIPSENKNKEEQGVIKLLEPAKENLPELKPVPKTPDLIQESVDPPPAVEKGQMDGDMRVYIPKNVDDKKKGRPEKSVIKIQEYVSTGKLLRPVKQPAVETEEVAPQPIIDRPSLEQKSAKEPVYTRTSFIDQNTPDREDITFVERSDEELLILEVLVNSRIRSKGIFSYLNENGGLLIPLYSFVEAMGFPIDVKPGAGLAKGWFIDEKNTFQLSAPDYSVVVGGKELRYQEGMVEVHADDIYVNRQALEEWFGVNVSLDMSTLRLLVKVDTPLPYEDKWGRRETWERVAESREGGSRQSADIPYVELPYKLVSMPVAKTNYTYDYSKTGDGDISDTLNGTIELEGDAMYMTGNLAVSFGKNSDTSPKIYDTRFTLRRMDDDGNLPLGASKIEVGDIALSGVPLIGSSKNGRGVSFIRKPKGYVSNPEDFILEGLAPIGWDVELYLNRQLVDFQTVGSDGEYSFSNLALNKGDNVVKVVTYGLDGEKRERIEHFYVGPGMLTSGSLAYEISAIESIQRLFPVADVSGIEDKRPSFLLSADYGVNKDFSITGSAYHGPLLYDSEAESAVSTGVRATIFRNIYFTADVASQSLGGESGQAQMQWINGNRVFSLGTNRYWSFLQTEKNELSNSFVRWSDTLFPPFMHPINYVVGYTKNRFIQGETEHKISTSISSRLFGISFNNQLDSTHTAGSTESVMDGQFTAGAQVFGTTLRGRMSYKPKADEVIENVSVTGQKSINTDVTLNGTLQRTFGAEGELSGTTSMRIAMDKMALAFTAGASESGNLNAGLTLSSNTLPTIADDGGYTYESYGNKSGFNVARLNVRTFLDRDGDGSYSEGDDLLEGVTMKDERRGNTSTTNRDGLATLKNLVPFTRTNIGLDVLSLPDIYYVPVHNRLQVEPRPGLAGLIDFPITVKGEVTGQVYLSGEINKAAPERAYIKLTDVSGKVIQEMYTERDGFFILGDIPIGKYFVQVASTENVIPLSPAIPVEVNFDSPVTDDLEFQARIADKVKVYQ